MKHCLVFASLISPSKMILFEKKYQTFDIVFHHQMKHLEVRQKYSAARLIFNSLICVSSGDETLHLMFDILHHWFDEMALGFATDCAWSSTQTRKDILKNRRKISAWKYNSSKGSKRFDRMFLSVH